MEDHGRMESESQLMAVRLAAISEILTLQEKALTQVQLCMHAAVCVCSVAVTVYVLPLK